MARFNRNNLGNYIGHFGRGALLIVGALAIIGLVLATFFYGNEQRQTVQDQGQTEQQVAQETDQQPDAANQDQQSDESDDSQTSNEQNDQQQVDGQAGSTAGNGGDQQGQVAGQTDQSPQEIANTGPVENYVFISIVLFVLIRLYRRSSLALEQAQIK